MINNHQISYSTRLKLKYENKDIILYLHSIVKGIAALLGRQYRQRIEQHSRFRRFPAKNAKLWYIRENNHQISYGARFKLKYEYKDIILYLHSIAKGVASLLGRQYRRLEHRFRRFPAPKNAKLRYIRENNHQISYVTRLKLKYEYKDIILYLHSIAKGVTALLGRQYLRLEHRFRQFPLNYDIFEEIITRLSTSPVWSLNMSIRISYYT